MKYSFIKKPAPAYTVLINDVPLEEGKDFTVDANKDIVIRKPLQPEDNIKVQGGPGGVNLYFNVVERLCIQVPHAPEKDDTNDDVWRML